MKTNTPKLKIIIDRAIPFLSGIFEPYAEVHYICGSEFSAEIVHDADALIIRTRTKCDASLLEGSSVKMIATATIGFDHIDMEYCQSQGVEVTTAAGCNARGVLQWVAAALAHLSRRDGWSPSKRTIGVVGVGNVGRLVEAYCRAWGFEVLRCDPPRAKSEGGFIELEELLPRVDIVTLHTPLDSSTYHLLNSDNIGLLKPSATILNSSRGEVIDTTSLLNNPHLALVLDVWESEPTIDRQLLNNVAISTPHIAGYSIQGKANGASMVVRSVAKHFGLPLMDWYPEVARNEGCPIEWDEMLGSITQHFDIEAESNALKEQPSLFEQMRNSYHYRDEYF